MKKATATALVVLLASLCASAGGLLPTMVQRRGITNEQIDFILAKHPDAELRLTARDWRGMRYQLFRFHNMTNYVEQIGGSNDCAKVLLRLHDTIEEATATNALLRATSRTLETRLEQATERAQEYADAYTASTNRIASLFADFTSATNRASIAEAKVARTEAFKAWLVEQRDKALLPTTKAIYQAILDKMEDNQ